MAQRRGIKLMSNIKSKEPIRKLQVFMSECDPEEKAMLAGLVGTTLNNLYQIAGGHSGASEIRALMIEAATTVVANQSRNRRLKPVPRHAVSPWFKQHRKHIKQLAIGLGDEDAPLRLFVA